MPDEAKLSAPGWALASAIRSLTFFTGSAGTVFNHELLSDALGEFLRDYARHEVGCPARSERHDHPDRPGRVAARYDRRLRVRSRGGECCSRQNKS
jgi:hypothetical protein